MSKSSESNKRHLFYKVGLIVVSIILSLIFLPTLIWGVIKGPTTFFSQKIHSNQSSDGKFKVDVYRKVKFPANEFLDPSITVYVSLKNIQENYEINSVQFELFEISDLEEPNITWTSKGVHIDNIDTHKQFSFDLRLPDYVNQY